MTNKPTYEELEKQVKELHKETLVLREEKIIIQEQFNLSKIILSATPDFLVLKDRDFVYQAVNPAFCEFLGKTEESIIGKTDFDLFPRFEAEMYHRDDLKVIKTGKPQVQDEEVTGEDEKRWLRVAKTPVLSEKAASIGVLCSVVDITENKRAEKELQKKANDLSERVKELNCLYGISKIRERSDIAFEEMLQKIVDLIPPSWQYPEVTCARIIIEGQEYKTKNFKETVWKQTSKIVVYGKRAGILEICYIEEKPESHEGPFLKEERSLISAITERLGRVTERKLADEALQKAHDELERRVEERTKDLEIKRKSLEELNTAMRILLKKRDEDKAKIEKYVLANVKQLIEPYFEKIKKTKLNDQQGTLLRIVESNLNEIISPFMEEVSLKHFNLTSTEIQIAKQIRDGNTTKKIAEFMNVSPRTVETHRKNIRRKIGLEGKKANLRTYLLSFN